MRHLKAGMLAFPELLSRCPRSVKLAVLLNAIRLDNKLWIEMEWPDGEWEALVFGLNRACEAYYKPVLETSPWDRISYQIRHLFSRNQRRDPDAYAGKDEDENVDVDYWNLIA
jgi:hypothetical protein